MGADGNCAICWQAMFDTTQQRFIKCPCVLLLGGPSNGCWITGIPLVLSFPLAFMFFLETFSPTLATLILTIFKTTQVVLPTLISWLTLLEILSYFTYGVIDVPLLLEIVFFPFNPSSTIFGPPLLKSTLRLRTWFNFKLVIRTPLGKLT